MITMRSSMLKGIGVMGGFFALAILVSVMSSPVGAQDDPDSIEKQFPDLKLKQLKKNSNFVNCLSCHQKLNVDPRPRDLVLLNEFPTWFEKDYHLCAFQVLETPLGKQMTEIIARARKNPAYNVTTDKACLACHSTYLGDDSVAFKDRTKADYDTAAGVQCEVCHGRSAALDGKGGWIQVHQNPAEDGWRSKSPADKYKLGQIDLRDPAIRAEKCASCHVGNLREGKLVTHEMYAAGHPPLPAFELLTFSTEEPMHWRYPEAVPYYKKLDAQVAKDLFHFDANDSAEARLLAVGAVVTFRENIKLLAAACAHDDVQSGQLLDFTFFDCYACHHDLVIPSRRQEFGYVGVPGRPVLRGTTTLLRAVTEDVDTQGTLIDQLDQKLMALRKALDVRAFGDPAQVGVAANAIVKWCDDVALVELNKKTYDKEATYKLALRLIQAGKSLPERMKLDPFDPEAARQLASAVNRLLEDDFASEADKFRDAMAEIGKVAKVNIRPKERAACSTGPVVASIAERNKLLYAFDPREVATGFDKLLGAFQRK